MELNDYLAVIPDKRREKFDLLRQLIKRLYPQAVESMRYKIPTFEFENGWVALANQKNYISLYTCSLIHIAGFKALYPNIKTGKGCINFKDKDEIPYHDLEAVIHSAMLNRH